MASRIFSLNPDLQKGHVYDSTAPSFLWRIECVPILNNCLLSIIDGPALLVLRKISSSLVNNMQSFRSCVYIRLAQGAGQLANLLGVLSNFAFSLFSSTYASSSTTYISHLSPVRAKYT
jgi:hypothetical protein